MSIRAVTFSLVACDGCGTEYAPGQLTVYKGATAARIAASRDGWKFAEYPEHKRNLPGPRMWDACPDCPLPATSAGAQELLATKGEVCPVSEFAAVRRSERKRRGRRAARGERGEDEAVAS